MTDREIAETLGCDRSNITQRLNRHGIIGRKSKIENIELRDRISNSLLGRFVGENNPNYKGYRDEKTIMRGLFKTISRRMIRKSDFTCQMCGRRGGDLETHHKRHFSELYWHFINNIYDGNINTIYQQLTTYKDFFDESNLVVLCRDCHRKIHRADNHEPSLYKPEEGATTIERADIIGNQVEYTRAGGSAGAVSRTA